MRGIALPLDWLSGCGGLAFACCLLLHILQYVKYGAGSSFCSLLLLASFGCRKVGKFLLQVLVNICIYTILSAYNMV